MINLFNNKNTAKTSGILYILQVLLKIALPRKVTLHQALFR